MKSLNPLPERMTKTCQCGGKFGDKRCQCVSCGRKCVLFCHEKSTGGLCKNKLIWCAEIPNIVTADIVDAPCLVHMITPDPGSTFEDYRH